MPVKKLPVIGVMGSGSEPHEELAAPLGRWIAARGAHLLTGGGGGVMRAVAEAFVGCEPRAGLSLGVLPGSSDGTSRPGYPNDRVELAIRTHLPLSGEQGQEPMSRNHINVLSADVVIALPGGLGTRSEVALALRYGRPVVLFGPAPALDPAFEGMAPEPPRAETLEALARLVDVHLDVHLDAHLDG